MAHWPSMYPLLAYADTKPTHPGHIIGNWNNQLMTDNARRCRGLFSIAPNPPNNHRVIPKGTAYYNWEDIALHFNSNPHPKISSGFLEIKSHSMLRCQRGGKEHSPHLTERMSQVRVSQQLQTCTPRIPKLGGRGTANDRQPDGPSSADLSPRLKPHIELYHKLLEGKDPSSVLTVCFHAASYGASFPAGIKYTHEVVNRILYVLCIYRRSEYVFHHVAKACMPTQSRSEPRSHVWKNRP